MRRPVCRASALITLGLIALASAAAGTPPPARAGVAADIDAALATPALARAAVGVQVVRLGPTPGDAHLVPQLVYRHDAGLPLTPASNLKLLTTSAAVDQLGPEFAFHTRLVQHGADLILVGDGDPALEDAELIARPHAGGAGPVLGRWAGGLRGAGVPRVGRVSVDDSVFDPGELFHPHWPADQRLLRYEAEVAGLNLNFNCLDVYVRPTSAGRMVDVRTVPATAYAPVSDDCRTGKGAAGLTRPVDANALVLRGHADAANVVPMSITVHDPALYAGTVLAEAVTAAGVPVAAGTDVRRDVSARAAVARNDPEYRVLAVATTPLSVVIARANKDSANLYAECLCKRLGAEANGGAGGTWANGTAAVAAFCRKVGVPADQAVLDDGCGLSKANAVTAAAVTQVLTYDFASPHALFVMESLAVAGTDGTLEGRFAHTTLRGRVRAKTGTVSGVSCLSGYLYARDGQWYAFSILMNRVAAGVGKPIQERIVKAIDDAAGR